MSPETQKLLEEALKLPPEARAALAGILLDSLDEPVEAGSEEEWSREILARIRELDSSAIQAIPWTEARRAIVGE